MKQCIAERRLLMERLDTGERRELVIRIGTPYQKSEYDFRCPVEYVGLFEKMADISGVDAIQALALACDIDLILKNQLKYRFYWVNGADYFGGDDDIS